MNSRSGRDGNDNNRRAKAIAATIPMAGVLVAAALLSALSLFGISPMQQVSAQNVTGGAAPAGGGGNATSAGGGGNQSSSPVGSFIQQACTSIKSGDTQGALMQLTSALNALGGGAQGGNMTTSGGAAPTGGGGGGNATNPGGNQSGGPLQALKNLFTGGK